MINPQEKKTTMESINSKKKSLLSIRLSKSSGDINNYSKNPKLLKKDIARLMTKINQD